jgi:dolichol-phosphate mannosyltransferase
MIARYFRFSAVGILGIGVRLAVVAAMVDLLGLHYLVGTAIGVEASLVHNFVWHERWTFRTPATPGAPARPGLPPGAGSVATRFVAFHAGSGLVSMIGTLAVMPALVGWIGLHYLAANLVAIGITSFGNFLLNDRLVFRPFGR